MALKVGIVGYHGIALSHTDAYVNDELGDFVAICDVVKERADACAEKYGVKAYYSLQDMLDGEPDLDIVDVCTGGYENGSWHYEPAMEAMAAGKHVLVEKPISSQVTEAREMVAFAADMGVCLGVDLNHYFTPPAEKAMEYINSGMIGEQVYCLHKMGFQGGEPDNYAAPGSRKIKGWPYFHLKAFLTHPFSLMRHFCGNITHVQAFCNRPGFRRRVGDTQLSTASIHVRFENDAVGYLLSQRGDASYGLGGWWSFELAGTQGTFCIENCIEKITYWGKNDPRGPGAPSDIPEDSPQAPIVTKSGTHDFGGTFGHRIHAFLEDITNGVWHEDIRASGRDGLAVLEYTFAVIDSYESGGELVQPYPLPPIHGDPSTVLD